MAADGLVFGAAPIAATPEFQPGNLETKFIEPPFSVLDTRSGRWQDRRRSWLSLGLQSELGRGSDVLFDQSSQDRLNEVAGTSFAATSIFDPVLCELAYRWWAPPGGRILDPFAGGSVRGVVAAMLGHPYTGIDLSGAQLRANREQAGAILELHHPQPRWIEGDTLEVLPTLETGYDMVMTCPPYYDLEVYSDDPRDLSNVSWGEFVSLYQQAMDASAHLLAPDRFSVWVVSEVRDGQGFYRGLVPLTVQVAEAAGLRLYNEAVLVNSAGTLPLRVTRQFEAGRKLGRVHQNVLCFIKGSPPRGWSYDRAAPPRPQLELFGPEPSGPAEVPSSSVAEPAPAASHDNPAEPVAEPLQPTRCEDHEPGHHATQAEADECSAETYGEVGWDAGGEPLRDDGDGPLLTPVEQHGAVWLKRDDLFEVAGVRGGKARTCWRLAQGAPGLVTAGSRSSPQANIVAQVARELGIPARVHMPAGDATPEQQAALDAGAVVVPHRPGHNSVIVARAREDAAARGWREIPFGMECDAAVDATAEQVANLPAEARRVVVPVGSGMSLAGITQGMAERGRWLPILGVVVGANPERRLDRWAADGWREHVTLVPSGSDYHAPAAVREYDGVPLDAHYEAKAAQHLQPGDVLWCVGIRMTQAAAPELPADSPASQPAPGRAGAQPDAAVPVPTSADEPRQRPLYTEGPWVSSAVPRVEQQAAPSHPPEAEEGTTASTATAPGTATSVGAEEQTDGTWSTGTSWSAPRPAGTANTESSWPPSSGDHYDAANRSTTATATAPTTAPATSSFGSAPSEQASGQTISGARTADAATYPTNEAPTGPISWGEPAPEAAQLRQLEDGRYVDTETGELFEPTLTVASAAGTEVQLRESGRLPVVSALRAPMPQAEWELARGRAWNPGDPNRPCWACGRPPTGRFKDGSPSYDHSHNPQVLAMFAGEEVQP